MTFKEVEEAAAERREDEEVLRLSGIPDGTSPIVATATGGVAGMAAGAAAGAIAGPIGMVAGAVLGAVAGAAAGLGLDDEATVRAHAEQQRDDELGGVAFAPEAPLR